MRGFRAVLAVVIVACVLTSSASAQQRFRISGRVVDKSDNAMPGVLVRVRRGLETLAEQRTGGSGQYSLEFPKGTPIDIVEYECYDCYPCSIISVSGAINHSVTKVIVKKGTQLSANDRSEIRATLEYYRSNPETNAEQVARYADLINEMLPATPAKSNDKLAQETQPKPPSAPVINMEQLRSYPPAQFGVTLTRALEYAEPPSRPVMVASASTSWESPSDPLALARSYFKAGRDEDAFAEAHRVLKSNQTMPEAYLLLGGIYARRGDLNTAINVSKTALFWEPRSLGAHLILSEFYIARGDYQNALSHADTALQLDPTNSLVAEIRRKVRVTAAGAKD